jgi:two-component system NtrC family sensor kinase
VDNDFHNKALLARIEQERDRAIEQMAATAEVLQIISQTPESLSTVFSTLLLKALQLCHAEIGILFNYDGEEYTAMAMQGTSPEFSLWLNRGSFKAGERTGLGRIARSHEIVHVEDIVSEDIYRAGDPLRIATADLGGARTFLAVPMMRAEFLVGAFTIYRQEVRPFDQAHIDLVKAFSSQAVIAIENARLVNELRQRTDDLTRSLENLRAVQNRLVQTEKLASLGQLTAGIAHEIKNPLNFVNNFSALSAELIEEMKSVLSKISMDENRREELSDITQLLKTNLEKVVQHGKRADSIVKNMLQHSREGAGEHRPADINAIVDESLNLAYHSARAEKAGFSIVLQRDLDPSVGMADVYPQEITRVLLNLISNGFYATTKRKVEVGDGFEPMLSATTKNLGDKVEIRIRDNGTGIPEEVKEKIFNPFFTTKPSGEGTGLGLSMSHDIIVKQHGGSIGVETQPGLFTEFKIVLPRKSQR